MNLSSPTTDRPLVAIESPIETRLPPGRAHRIHLLPVMAACVALLVFAYVAKRAGQRLYLDQQLAAARECLRNFQPDTAIERLSAVTTAWPTCAEGEFLLAAAYRRGGELDQVDPHLKRAAELGWDQEAIERQYCLTFFQAGDFRRAAKDLTEELKQSASDDDAEETYEAMARGYMAALLLQQANYVLEGWLKWRPNCAQARLLQAGVAVLAGNERRELECYQNAVDCDPANFEARRCLAQALLAVNQIDQAAQLYEACIRQRPNEPSSLIGLAECRQRQSRTEEARTLLGQSLDLKPVRAQKAAALALMGQIAVESKLYEQASQLYKEAVEAHPANMPAVYSLAQALARAGHGDEALHYQERFQQLKEHERHLEDLRTALLHEPGDADLRTEIGETLLEEGATAAGVNWLLSALLYDPDHAEAHLRLARYYDSAGKGDLAQRHRQSADRAMSESHRAAGPLAPAPDVLIPLRPSRVTKED